MATLSPPSSQKAGDRPISFLLDNQAGGAPQAFVDLVIRPEDLSRTDPSRANVTHSLGGAWVDDFGAGIPQITISGHTGWRRVQGSDEDGLERFKTLRSTVFDRWHELRAENREAGKNPDDVRLIFSDALDDFSVVVAPMNFVLRRSRSRPLLAQYQISLMVVDTALQNQPYPAQFGYQGATPANALARQASGLSSLIESVKKITAAIQAVRAWVQTNLVAPVQAFMRFTAELYGAVREAIATGQALVGDLIGVARDTALAGINIFRSIAAVASIPQLVKADLMAIAGAYTNIFCVLRNAVGGNIHYQDYTDLYGASNCSSTAGGRPISPLAGENPFYKVVPTPGPLPLSMTTAAQDSFRSLANVDPVLAPPSMAMLATQLTNIAGGARMTA